MTNALNPDVPAAAGRDAIDLSALSLPAGWRREQYTRAGRPVTVLRAEPGASPLPIPLHSPGWQRIHLGVYRPIGQPARLQAKLASQPYWRTIQPYVLIADPGNCVQTLDLGPSHVADNDALLIQPSAYGSVAIASLSVTAAAAPAAPHRGRAGAVIDVHDVITRQYRIDQPDDLLAVLAPYAESSFDRICWGTAAGTFRATYFSDVMPVFGDCGSQTPPGLAAARTMHIFRDRRIDPLDWVIDLAHRMGMQLWADDRVCHAFEPNDASTSHLTTPFVVDNQAMRVLDMNGKPNEQSTLSLAYAGFADLKIRFLVEQARRGVDGIYLDFTRKLPIVGAEPAVLDSFIAAHGIDPRREPRQRWIADWLRHRCSFVTAFIRRLRAALDDAVGPARRMPIAVQVPHGWSFSSSMLQCQFDGLDVIAWAREGLIDVVAPSGNLWNTPISLDRFTSALAGTSCELWGCVHQRARECLPGDQLIFEAHVDPMLVARNAADLLNQGAAGIFLWESGELPTVPQRWDVLRHLGNAPLLQNWFTPALGSFDGHERIQQQRLEDPK